MDTSDSEIQFDHLGNCNHCNDFLHHSPELLYKGEESKKILNNIVTQIRSAGKKNEYDCLIGVSGGVDSSYVAYLVKELGLRPLAVHMDNGWNSLEAVENIKNICNKLEIDYQSYVLNWHEFKDIQLSVLKSSIPEVEMPTDIAIAAVLHKVAAENNIKYIIGGGNLATEGILPDSWFYNPKDSKLLRAIHRKYGAMPMNSFPLFDYKKEIYYKFVKGIKMVYLLNYLSFLKEDAISVLKDKLDWKVYGRKHHESKYTSFVQSYIQTVKFNIDYRRATLSTQICTGEITRNEALEILKNSPFDQSKVEADKEYVCKKLDISTQEFEEIMSLPVKLYKDYPNDHKKLEFIYNVYRKYFKKPTFTL
jgi:N-acetyl sugar amidotransferase